MKYFKIYTIFIFLILVTKGISFSENLLVNSLKYVEIYIDGSYVSSTDSEGMANIDIAPGEHKLIAMHPDYTPVKKTLNVKAGQQSTIEINFATPQQGSQKKNNIVIIQDNSKPEPSVSSSNDTEREINELKLKALKERDEENTPCLNYSIEPFEKRAGGMIIQKEEVTIRCKTGAYLVQGERGGPYVVKRGYGSANNFSELLSIYRDICGCKEKTLNVY